MESKIKMCVELEMCVCYFYITAQIDIDTRVRERENREKCKKRFDHMVKIRKQFMNMYLPVSNAWGGADDVRNSQMEFLTLLFLNQSNGLSSHRNLSVISVSIIF